jgi:signal transduction histidine kinase
MSYTGRERVALRDLWDALQAWHDQIQVAVEEAARRIPMFAAVMDAMSPEMRAAQDARSTELQREALLDGRWERYDEDLRTQGKTYAQMGIPFQQWHPLLHSFREVLFENLRGDEERMRSVILGCDLLLDHAMSIIGEAYIEAKQDLVRQAEGQLRLHIDLVQSAPVAMMIYHCVDAAEQSFRAVASNAAAVRLGLGAPSPEELTRWMTCLSDGQPQQWVETVVANEVKRTLETKCFSLGDQHIGIIAEDITERQRMQDEIVRHVHDLERSNRDLDEFAYVASHDLKAPLQDVRNLSAWIREDAGDKLPPPSARHMELLVDRVNRMERLLDDLLDYSRAGRPAHSSENVDVRDVVRDIMAFFGPPNGFTIEHSGEAVTLWTPRAPFEQVVRNLVGNAIKHHDRESGHVVVTTQAKGDRISVCVADDGPGIPPEFHERVFRMFQTLRSRDEVEGSGMGLAIVRKTVEAYGGTIALASRGRGTAITFTWPQRTDTGVD